MEYEKLDDLKRIKKEYGENMAHLCRSLFPSILEKPGLLYHILSTHFAKSKSLYGDITSEHKEFLFKEYIYFFADQKSNKNKQIVTKTVKELLDEAGYVIYECNNNRDIQKFKKYYKKGEELCTFKDPYRIDNHYIFFIVKKDVDKIKRERFKNPKREDEYSTSVLDLQFDKGKRQRISIKSRYNHTVDHPDATYSNNLEAIALGLTRAFEQDYGFNIGEQNTIGFELNDYVEARDGKFYKYNYEVRNIHYCPNNIIINNGRIDTTYADKSRYTSMDYFILDEKEKKIILYDEIIKDSFIDGLQNITNIEINNKEGYKEIKLTMEGNKEAIIKLDSRGRIIGYINNNLENVGRKFLARNGELKELQMDNLKECGDEFLTNNYMLDEISLPNVEKVGHSFIYNNEHIKNVYMPNVEKVGHSFIHNNKHIKKLYMPNLKKCGNYFLNCNQYLEVLNLPNLETCGNCFLLSNTHMNEVNLPKLKECGDSFLQSANILKKISLPCLEKCGDKFLMLAVKLRKIHIPNLVLCGSCFIGNNSRLTELSVPKLEKCGSSFLGNNKRLVYLNAPELKEAEYGFLAFNKVLIRINAPKLIKCSNNIYMYVNATNKTIKRRIEKNNKKYVDDEEVTKKKMS